MKTQVPTTFLFLSYFPLNAVKYFYVVKLNSIYDTEFCNTVKDPL